MKIPKEFWQACSEEQSFAIFDRGYMNVDDCKLLYRVCAKRGAVPKRIDLSFRREDVMKAFPAKFNLH